MVEREASGDFDYLLGETVDVTDTDDAYFDAERVPGKDMSFDAFDENTWYFEPAPPPWYRTKQTLSLLVATSLAAVALVVSGVLLMFRGPGESAVEEVPAVSPTAQTTAPPSTAPASSNPPPPPPPRTAPSATPAPPPRAGTDRPRAPSTRPSRDPEIGVTRTPVTRSPISVAPQRPGQSQR